MDKVISATEARTNFGKVMRIAQETPVIVERAGVPQVVVISKRAYDTLSAGQPTPDWRSLLSKAHQMGRRDLQDSTLPDAVEIIQQTRSERNEQFNDLH